MTFTPTQGSKVPELTKKYKRALDKLWIEENKLTEGGKSDAADSAYREAIKARALVIAAGGRVGDIPKTSADRLKGDGTTPRKELSSSEKVAKELDRASISDDSGVKVIQASYPNTIGENAEPTVTNSFLYVEPATSDSIENGKSVKAKEMGIHWGTTDDVRNKYQKQLIKIYGSKEALYDKLYQAGYIKNKKFNPTTGTRDVLDGLQEAVADYSLAQINDYKDGKIKGDFPTMDAFLTGGNRDNKSLTRTTKIPTVYDDTRATGLIKNLYQKLQKRDPNEQEIKELIPLLQDFQKRNPEISTTTRNEDDSFTSGINKLGGDPEEFLIDKISQKDETKARRVLGYYDAFKSVIGVQ